MKKKVICDGAVKDPSGHQCKKRRCKHRILHKPLKTRCGVKDHNSDGWCVFPGTTSLIDGDTDGCCVTCMTEAQVHKEEFELKKCMLKNLEIQRDQLKEIATKNQKVLDNICKEINLLRLKTKQ